MHRRPSDRTLGLAVVSSETLLAVFGLTGLGPLLHPGRVVIGRNPSNDFQIMAWSLRFWPWAIEHGVAPRHTSLLWAPTGFSTLWLTTIPGPALAAAPLTLTARPIATYNVLVVVAIVAAGVAAYLLCWELTRNAAASVAGGLLFGLSPFVLGHMLSEHLNLLVIFPLPLLVLTGLRSWRGALSTRTFVTAFALLLLVLLSSSLELFADTTAVLAIVAAISIVCGGSRRTALLALARRIAYAYAACLPVLVPVGIAAFSSAHGPVTHPPVDFSTDALNTVLPTPTVLLGSLGSIAGSRATSSATSASATATSGCPCSSSASRRCERIGAGSGLSRRSSASRSCSRSGRSWPSRAVPSRLHPCRSTPCPCLTMGFRHD